MENISAPLIWLILGFVLVIVELVSMTFFLMFIGVGAMVTALAAFLGVTGVGYQILIFCASSVILIVALRKSAKRLFFGHKDLPQEFVGKLAEVIKDIPAAGEGSVMYRGSHWIAFTEGGVEIKSGSKVRILANDGIRLKVANEE